MFQTDTFLMGCLVPFDPFEFLMQAQSCRIVLEIVVALQNNRVGTSSRRIMVLVYQDSSTEYLSASSRQGSQCQNLLEMRSSCLEHFAFQQLFISRHVRSEE